MDSKKTKSKTIRLNVLVIRKVEERARTENRNFSNMVETLLIRGLESRTIKSGN